MARAALLLTTLLFLPSAGNAGEFHTNDPLKSFVRGEYAWGDDYFIHGNEDTTLFRCVLVKGKDGFDGVAFSEVSIWGNHGGPWEIFRKSRKGFDYVGSRELRDTSCLESCRSKDYLASGRCDWQHGWPSSAAPAVGAGSDRPSHGMIGTLTATDLSAAPFECDCEFYRGPVSGDTVVFATRAHRMRGLAKIDGRMLSLHLVSKRADPACRNNRRFEERWSAGSVSIHLAGVVTTSGAEACWYEGRMTVAVDSHDETIPVTGSCGC